MRIKFTECVVIVLWWTIPAF